MKYLKSEKGITIFIAVVIMGILLFISFAVISITVKGTMFVTSGRDSQYAFYAADTGLECALYWDSKKVVSTQIINGTSYPIYDSAFATSTDCSPIICAGQSLSSGSNINGTTSVTTRIGGGGNANSTSVFGFQLGSKPYCAIVTVTKYYNGGLKTYIKSRGYNTCDLSNSRRVERGIEVTY